MLLRLLLGISRTLPSACAICAAWPAEPVCEDCRTRFARPRHRCLRCALPLAAPSTTLCGRCVRRPPTLTSCIAAVDYAYPWAGCIGRFKFGSQPGWAAVLAGLVLDAPGLRERLTEVDLVVPLPLSRDRLRSRGFNQALELARELAPDRVEAQLLLRVRETQAQSSLDRARRQTNVRGAFAVDPLSTDALAGRRVLLVDDVMTSGASLEEAARCLLAAGAREAHGVVVARTEEH